MMIDQLCYADTVGGRNLAFLAKCWRKAFDAGNYRKAAAVARMGAVHTNCRIWSSTVAVMEMMAV